MAKSYTLHRGGQSIQIEKEPEFITAILPNQRILNQVNQTQEVKTIKKVFRNIYKIRTAEGATDALSDRLRANFQTKGIFHHSYNPVGDKTTRYYLTDKIIVCFAAKASASAIEKLLAKHGLQYLREFPGHKNTFLLKVTSSAGKNPVKVSADMMNEKLVDFAEPNLINRFVNHSTPKDELFVKQWHLNNKGGIEMIKGADVSALEAWKISMGTRSVVVSVIDDGFDLRHPDLLGADKIVSPKDFVDGDLRPFPVADADDYHGSPCAGVAIGNHNDRGIVGIAPECSFNPVRFPLTADDSTLWDIFDHASKAADVISCSWGPPPVYDPLGSILQGKFSQITKSGGPRGNGALICFSAGNYNAPLKDYNNNSFFWRHPAYGVMENKGAILNGYCTHPDVVAVAASTSQNRKSAYSNWGKEIDVCSPSDNWNPLDPYAKEPGRGIWTVDNEKYGTGFSDGIYTGDFGGTSSACPLVAGIAALIRSVNLDLTAKQVKNILRKSTDKITDKNPDPVLGNTKGTYNSKGHSEWFGYGKVNAHKALKMALATKKPEPPKPPKPKTGGTKTTNTKTEGLSIIAALVNPAGKESGNETVSLVNQSKHNIDLQGWKLQDNKKREQVLGNITINAGAFLTIPLQTRGVQLSNSGGSIYLLDQNGKTVHEVSYTKKEVSKDGWMIVFE